MTIRPETLADSDAVRRVNEAAFGQADEADIVERLRERAAGYLGLVAEEDGAIVGHIAFSAVTADVQPAGFSALGLAPMAVLPAHQRRGVGGALVQAGLAAGREAGADIVVVLGHPDYYPRFGFEPAHRHGLRDAYGAPPEAFMALELTPGTLAAVSGTVRYDPALAS